MFRANASLFLTVYGILWYHCLMMNENSRETKTQKELFYLAPMEGITGHVFRQVYLEQFGGIDKYFSPFLAPAAKRILKNRERRDVEPDNNRGQMLVPQILTRDPVAFLAATEMLGRLGYQEINLNLGCPSPTVVPKGKGAGFLQYPEELDRFFDRVFSGLEERLFPGGTDTLGREVPSGPFRISVKTRLGMQDPQEFPQLLAIFNRYPLEELIVHARVREDYYSGKPDLETFGIALEESRAPVCYNGDIYTAADYQVLKERFPGLCRFMLGRGIVGDPGLVQTIRDGRETQTEELRTFHNRLYAAYVQEYGNSKDAVFRMKELWAYMQRLFPEEKKRLKQIRKAQNGDALLAAAEEMFRQGRRGTQGIELMSEGGLA